MQKTLAQRKALRLANFELGILNFELRTKFPATNTV